MRRTLVFAVLSAPALVFAGVSLWAQSEVSGWTPADGELSLAIRASLALNSWTIRLLPFVGVGLGVGWPVVVLAIAAVTGSFSPRNTATHRDVVLWWCVSAGAFVAVLATGGIVHLLQPEGDPPLALLVSLAWIAVAAFWVSMSAVFAVQQKRYLAQESIWGPKWLLAGLFALSCFGVFVLPILAVVVFRKGASGHEVAG
jgi:hypothetical protein